MVGKKSSVWKEVTVELPNQFKLIKTTVAQITTVVQRRESLNVQHLAELQQQRRTRHCGYNLMRITKTGETFDKS